VRAVFIYNPVATACPRNLEGMIRERFPAAAVWTTEGPRDGERLGARAVEEGAEVVVACGGDGTFREVATAVDRRATLGLVPVGTVNLLALALGVPGSPSEALAMLEQGKPTAVYPGRCVPGGGVDGTLFFLCVSAGPDADVVHAVAGEKRVLGRYAYPLRFATRLLRPVPDALHWEAGGRGGRCGQFLALRLHHYAGAYRVSETCSPFSPGLELVAVGGGRRSVVAFFVDVLRSRIRPRSRVVRVRADLATLELPGPGRFQVDGDPFTARRLTLRAEHSPVRVVLPPAPNSPAALP